MTWLSFFASVIGSLAWPATTVAVVLILRRGLNKLLPDLTRVKYKDLELQFGQQLAQAKAEVEAGPQPPLLPEGAAVRADEVAYFQTLAEVSPRAAVLEAWLPFEITASRMAQTLGLAKSDRPLQLPALLDGLKRQGILTGEEVSAVSRLRAIRNAVVHAPTVDLPKESVTEYAAVLREVTRAMENRMAERS